MATSILQGLGRAGADIGTGAGIVADENRQNAEAQLRQLQAKMQFAEFQQRLKEFQARQQTEEQKQPANMISTIEKSLNRKLTDDEKQRFFGIQPPTPKAKYSSMRYDDKGKLWGLNTETNMEEQVPSKGEFNAPKKASTSPLGKVNPIVAAQIGKPPDPAKYPQGEDDPGYKGAMKLWGIEAEKISTRMAQSGAAARGAAYQLNRVGNYITPDGELVTATGGEAIKNGYVGAAPGFQAMSKQAQFGEIKSASGKLRDSITALQADDAFSAPQVIQMLRAMQSPDQGSLSASINNLMASGLNDRQQDYVIWLGQMAERILSIRSIAGMGQGAEDLRRAIQATIPNVASGSKEFALKRLDAVDNQISQLYRGIPSVKSVPNQQQGVTPPPGAKIVDMTQ